MLHRCHRPGCRCVNCTIDGDDFNRADSTNLGPKWAEVSGGFAISGNRLAPSASFENLVVFNTLDPETDDGIRWTAKYNFGGSTGQAWWIVDYVNSSNYRYAVVACTGTTSATLRLYEKVGGGNAELTSAESLFGFDWSTDFTLAVCWGVDYLQPRCSVGTVGWVWTLDYFGPGLPGWQPRIVTGDCQTSACGGIYPEVTGTELEGDTTTTNCEPIFGGSEGEPVNTLKATFNGIQSVIVSAVPLGGLQVGLLTAGASTSSRFDDATLSTRRAGCPDCGSDTQACEQCSGPRPGHIRITLGGNGLINGSFIMEATQLFLGIINGYCDETESFGACCWLAFNEGGDRSQTIEFGSGRGGYFMATVQQESNGDYAFKVGIRFWEQSVTDGSDYCDLRFRILLSEDGLPDCMIPLEDADVPYFCHENGTETLFSGAETCHVETV